MEKTNVSETGISEENVQFNTTLQLHEDVWTPAAIQRMVTLSVIMFVALVGNCIILTTLTCSRYRIRVGLTSSRVSIFILNLAISDLTVCLVTMPGEMVFTAFGEWILGAVACKLIVFGQIVALASTIFNLLAMSYDRYLAICQPLRFRNSVSRARKTIAIAWLLAFVLSTPQLFIFVQVQRGTHSDGTPIYDCASHGYTAWWQRRLYFSCLTVFILIVPAAVITFCYVSIVGVVWRQGKLQTVVASSSSVISLRKTGTNNKTLSRAKVRTIKLTLCIIVAFVACWTPYFVVHNIRVHTHYEYKISDTVRAFAETFALLNSALNPIVYGCFNLRVKKALHESCCVCGRPRSGMDPILGSTFGTGHARATPGSDCSSSYVEESTVIHASAASTASSPGGSGKFRVVHGKLNGGGGGLPSSPQLPRDGHYSPADVGGCRRGNSCRKNCEMFELKRRPTRRNSRP